MPVDEALVHNWFFGNHVVRELASLIFGLLMGALPVGAVAAWLVADLRAPAARLARAAVPAIDLVRGFIPVAIVAHGGGIAIGLGCGLALSAGDRLSPWGGFRDGRGAAIAAGVMLALSPPAALACAAIGLATALASGYVAAGTLLAAAMMFFPLWFFLGASGAGYGLATGILIVSAHLDAFGRILEGTEPRLRPSRPRLLPAVEGQPLQPLEV
jgi:glycerol-3-phosphate acyltransferase PlsY